MLEFKVKQKGGNKTYVAEILNCESVVNVHFEREKGGYVIFYQRATSDGQWSIVRTFGASGAPLVFDENLVSDYYPMSWKIESQSPVVSATLSE